MVKYVVIVLLAVLSLNVHSQTISTYQSDLDSLYAVLRKTPSFNEQITGPRLQDYQALYQQLKADTLHLRTDYDVFYQLSRLFFPFKDNHLGFYQIQGNLINQKKSADTTAAGHHQTAKADQEYPKVNIRIDSLEIALAASAKDSVEGIYYYDTYLKIGLYRSQIKNQLIGVVLRATDPVWEPGQIAIRLYEYSPDHFRAIYGHPLRKLLMLNTNEKFRRQSLINSSFYGSPETVYKKNPGELNFAAIGKSKPVFQYERIKKDIDYLRLGSFSPRPADMRTAQQFYERIKDSLTASHLVVDLRDNTGGAWKVARPFVNLIEQYSANGKVYVLINNGTMSQGERVTLRLKKLAGLKTYGEPTKGTITYGSNYGKTVTLPSGKYVVYPTDMNDGVHFLPYENFGVLPDITLQNDRDWVDQLVGEIDRHP